MTSVFFVLLVVVIIATALLYHSRRRLHQIEVANFQNILAQTQLEIQEQTLQTIGAELHDNVGQLLSLTSLTLNSIQLTGNPTVQQKIDDSIELTVRSIKEMRQLGHLLQGDQLVAAGLINAIEQLVRWLERTGKYEVEFEADMEMPANNNADKDLIIFRMAQEIFNNIIKHAAASRITIALHHTNGVLTMRVADNGIGFENNETLHIAGFGLQNIRKRAGVIGGNATISARPNRGTEIIVSVPYL